jgi:hypothetical protein
MSTVFFALSPPPFSSPPSFLAAGLSAAKTLQASSTATAPTRNYFILLSSLYWGYYARYSVYAWVNMGTAHIVRLYTYKKVLSISNYCPA